MTLADFIKLARNRLRHVFEERELQNILELLIEEVLEIQKHQQRLKQNIFITADQQKKLEEAVARLQQDEPVQYILESAWFFDLKFKVDKNVLIPRPETEELVDLAIKKLKFQQKSLRLLDVCTGSGCIAISLSENLPFAEVDALDISAEALKIAKENAMKYESNIHFHEMNFLAEDQWRHLDKYDAIISNPPYVSEIEFIELMKRVKKFEPRQALVPQHDDALIFYKKIAAFADLHLNNGGYIFLELNDTYADEVRKIFSKFEVEIKNDLQGSKRMLMAKK